MDLALDDQRRYLAALVAAAAPEPALHRCQLAALAREQALAAVDEMSAETSAIAAQLDADRRAEERMDADYGSGPRPGLDNLAAIPIEDPPLPLDRWLRERLAGLGGRVIDEVRLRPGWALMAAASIGYLAARSVHANRRAA